MQLWKGLWGLSVSLPELVTFILGLSNAVKVVPQTFLGSTTLQNSELALTEELLSYSQLCDSVIHKKSLSFCDFKSLWTPLSGSSGDAGRHAVASHTPPPPSAHPSIYSHALTLGLINQSGQQFVITL